MSLNSKDLINKQKQKREISHSREGFTYRKVRKRHGVQTGIG
jgi:hypothetical protein